MKMKYTISTCFGILLTSLLGVVRSTSADPTIFQSAYQNPANIIVAQSINQSSNTHNIYPFWNKKSGKIGFINQSGKVVITPQFKNTSVYWGNEGSDVYRHQDLNLTPVQVEDNKWGYINNDGKMIISPKFDLAYHFTEGLAVIKIGDKWGYINKMGKIVIDLKFDQIYHVYPFFFGVANITFAEKLSSGEIKEHKVGFIDRKGEFILEPKTSTDNFIPSDTNGGSRDRFHEGLLPVNVKGKWGYVNTKGEFVIKPQFFYAGHFFEGLAAVSINSFGGNRYINNRYINKSGQILFTLDNNKIVDDVFSEGLARFQLRGRRGYGFINRKGEVVISPKFYYAGNFSEGLACVQIYDEKKREYFNGYINKTGKFVIKPRFARVSGSSCDFESFHGELAYTEDSEYKGYINKQGSMVWKISNK
jgi:WG containing repeat